MIDPVHHAGSDRYQSPPHWLPGARAVPQREVENHGGLDGRFRQQPGAPPDRRRGSGIPWERCHCVFDLGTTRELGLAGHHTGARDRHDLPGTRGQRGIHGRSGKVKSTSPDRGDERAASPSLLHRWHQVEEEPRLHHVADGASGFRSEDDVFVVVSSEKHHGGG